MMLDSALELAAAGWAVFPLNGKVPFPGTHGHLEASRDPEVIRAWWRRWPDANVGTRVPDTLLVVDLDPRNGGSLEALEALVGPLPPTLTVWSGRNDGGRHLYFLCPHGPLASTRLPEGVDLKTSTGYVVLPPSLHPATGEPYHWELREPVAVPPRLRELLRPAVVARRPATSRHSDAKSAGLVKVVAAASTGNRNNALFWAACRAAEDGILPAVEAELVAAAVSAGLPEHGARRTVLSAARKFGVRA